MFNNKLFFTLIISFSLLFSLIFSVKAAEIEVNKIQFFEKDRLEIKLSGSSIFNVFTLKNPHRLVVDVAQANLSKTLIKKIPNYVISLRNQKNKNDLRLVFDLKEALKISEYKFSNNKITIQFESLGSNNSNKKNSQEIDFANFISNKVEEFESNNEKKIKSSTPSSKPKKKIILVKKAKRQKIIIIDAGHGGKDPGAIGRYIRSKEKNITLSYAKELKRQLSKNNSYKVYLTRNRDFFIPLRKRVDIARRKNADLFISIHANSAENRKAQGFSIYTLSETSSDKQAARLARKENRADIISGIDFSGASQDIMKTLIDMSQRESKNSSSKFANIVIKYTKKAGIKVLQDSHRFAGFAVLTAPDMASTLIELGYISNKHEERLLNSTRYKRKLVQALVRAIDQYFSKIR